MLKERGKEEHIGENEWKGGTGRWMEENGSGNKVNKEVQVRPCWE